MLLHDNFPIGRRRVHWYFTHYNPLVERWWALGRLGALGRRRRSRRGVLDSLFNMVVKGGREGSSLTVMQGSVSSLITGGVPPEYVTLPLKVPPVLTMQVLPLFVMYVPSDTGIQTALAPLLREGTGHTGGWGP